MTVHLQSSPAGVLGPAAAFEAGDGRVGGKALGLAKLARAGANVPWWVVLPVSAFERHLAQAGLHGLMRDTLATLTPDGGAAASEALATAIRSAPVDPELAAAVAEATDGHGPFAVRSSVVGEDSATHSFAGMFDSYLFLDDADQVVEAIKSCWASAFNARALAYVLNHGDAPTPPAVAVIVQQAVEGETSGVLFTSNPVSGRPDELLVSSCWGLGEGIVSGLCSTDELVWSHDGRELAATIADKDVQVLPDPAGGGTLEVPVPADHQAARSLRPETASELCRQGLAVAEELGAPQDIEWTLRGDELFLLQARPITSKLGPAPLGERRIAWDNSNIQESYNGVTTPLTFSLTVRGYERVHEETLRLLGVSEETIAEYRPVLRNMVGLVSGRVYYNINNWYRVLLLLPSFDKKKEDLEHMIGVDEPVDFIEGTQLTTAEKLRRLPGLLRVGARLGWRFKRREASIERFLSDFAATTGEIDRDQLAQADLDELLGWSQQLNAMVGDFAVPTVNDIYLMMTTGRLRKLVAQAAGDEAPEIVAGLMSGEEAIESKEPTRRLIEIAQLIRADAELGALLAEGTPAEALTALRERSPAVRAATDEYVERYGDRCMGEQKLETISLRQDPSFLAKILRNFVAQPDLRVETLDSQEQERREQTEEMLMASLGRRRRRRLRRALGNARGAVKARENMRFARTRLVGFVRAVYNAKGRRLHEAGLLDEPTDVFYLTDDELTAYIEGTAVTTDIAALTRLRRAEFAAYEEDELPNQFETIGSPYRGGRLIAGGRLAEADGPTLQGTGCSAGVVEAEVAVVLSPDDDLAVGGRILTTVRTDPGWGPLFPSAAGLLIERGSTLSHSAVLAREFGIPCVVGVPGLMKTIRHGERVRLDGGTGMVERLTPPPDPDPQDPR